MAYIAPWVSSLSWSCTLTYMYLWAVLYIINTWLMVFRNEGLGLLSPLTPLFGLRQSYFAAIWAASRDFASLCKNISLLWVSTCTQDVNTTMHETFSSKKWWTENFRVLHGTCTINKKIIKRFSHASVQCHDMWSVQHQISPYKISTWPSLQVMRIETMIKVLVTDVLLLVFYPSMLALPIITKQNSPSTGL